MGVMKLVIQRVKQAMVNVEDDVVGRIGKGMLVFLGVGQQDTRNAADHLVKKIVELRIFNDARGKMNCSALDVKAEFLIVSQFTLYANCDKGRRPSFDAAAEPSKAQELYEYFVQSLKEQGGKVETGRFAAMMDVSLVNDGPVTFTLEF